MNIAIVEDNLDARDKLVRMLTDFCQKNQIPLNLSLYSDGIEIIDYYPANFDVIYFDVEMPIMDGMTAAKKIRQIDDKVMIVFLTNYVQWAIEGYSVEATDFILKPITTFNFQEHFKKILTKIQLTTKASYTLKTNMGLRKILIDELIFVESEGHYLHFHTIDKDYTVLASMKSVEADLRDYTFFRCNNSYLVNLKFVRSIEGNVAYVDKYDLTISRPRKKGFLAALTNYLSRGGTSE